MDNVRYYYYYAIDFGQLQTTLYNLFIPFFFPVFLPHSFFRSSDHFLPTFLPCVSFGNFTAISQTLSLSLKTFLLLSNPFLPIPWIPLYLLLVVFLLLCSENHFLRVFLTFLSNVHRKLILVFSFMKYFICSSIYFLVTL